MFLFLFMKNIYVRQFFLKAHKTYDKKRVCHLSIIGNRRRVFLGNPVSQDLISQLSLNYLNCGLFKSYSWYSLFDCNFIVIFIRKCSTQLNICLKIRCKKKTFCLLIYNSCEYINSLFLTQK